MEEDEPTPGVNFIPCIKWVRRGVAKANPEKIQLTEEELEDIIKQTNDSLKVAVEDEDDENGASENVAPDTETGNDKEQTTGVKDKFNFDKYDEEPDVPDAMLGIGGLAVYASTSKDPYVTIDDADDLDSERGDDLISTSDNLVLVGHVEGDASILEVYVYNEGESSLYVHHDFLLPAYPLCIEWLNYDPEEEAPGNLCAVGTMDSIIQVWDLDLIDCLEPAFKLGRKARKKKGISGYGHKDAVLDLSWNVHLQHILASASADETVLLWDLENGRPATKLECFTDKVQSLEFHPFESQTLLVGCCDKKVRVFDCREEGAFKSWDVPGEVERVVWNHFDPFFCLASTSEGTVHYIDCRMDQPVWQLSAHNKEVTGLCLSPQCRGLLTTSGSDGLLKTWDMADGEPVFVHERPLSIGGVQCLAPCPDNAFVVAAGGDKKSKNFGVWEILTTSTAVENRFGTRELVKPVVVPDNAMDMDDVGPKEMARPSTSEMRPMKNFVSNRSAARMRPKKKK